MPTHDTPEAGRGMDALVAEKVMEWVYTESPDPEGLPWWLDENGSKREAVFLWQPTENIENAFEAVEAMACSFTLAFHPADAWDDSEGGGFNAPYWTAQFEDGPEKSADTAPLAICKAALAALQAGEGETKT